MAYPFCYYAPAFIIFFFYKNFHSYVLAKDENYLSSSRSRQRRGRTINSERCFGPEQAGTSENTRFISTHPITILITVSRKQETGTLKIYYVVFIFYVHYVAKAILFAHLRQLHPTTLCALNHVPRDHV